MRTGLLNVSFVLLSALLTGCATPSAQDLQHVDLCRAQAETVLESLGEVLRSKDPAGLRPLLSPDLAQHKAGALVRMVGQASWLTVYSGYTMDARAAVDDVGWRHWQGERVRLKVPGRNALGDRLPEIIELVNLRGEWYLADLNLAQPILGAELDPPAAVRQAAVKEGAKIIGLLRKEDFGMIHVSLPKEARDRPVSHGFWGNLIGREPGRQMIISDLRLLEEVDVHRWPDPSADLHLAWNSPRTLALIYDIPYSWPGGGIVKPDNLRLTISVRQDGEDWKMVRLRLSGKALE